MQTASCTNINGQVLANITDQSFWAFTINAPSGQQPGGTMEISDNASWCDIQYTPGQDNITYNVWIHKSNPSRWVEAMTVSPAADREITAWYYWDTTSGSEGPQEGPWDVTLSPDEITYKKISEELTKFMPSQGASTLADGMPVYVSFLSPSNFGSDITMYFHWNGEAGQYTFEKQTGGAGILDPNGDFHLMYNTGWQKQAAWSLTIGNDTTEWVPGSDDDKAVLMSSTTKESIQTWPPMTVDIANVDPTTCLIMLNAEAFNYVEKDGIMTDNIFVGTMQMLNQQIQVNNNMEVSVVTQPTEQTSYYLKVDDKRNGLTYYGAPSKVNPNLIPSVGVKLPEVGDPVAINFLKYDNQTEIQFSFAGMTFGYSSAGENSGVTTGEGDYFPCWDGNGNLRDNWDESSGEYDIHWQSLNGGQLLVVNSTTGAYATISAINDTTVATEPELVIITSSSSPQDGLITNALWSGTFDFIQTQIDKLSQAQAKQYSHRITVTDATIDGTATQWGQIFLVLEIINSDSTPINTEALLHTALGGNSGFYNWKNAQGYLIDDPVMAIQAGATDGYFNAIVGDQGPLYKQYQWGDNIPSATTVNDWVVEL